MVQDEQWIKDLQINKKRCPVEEAKMAEIIKQSDISTKHLIQKLDEVGTLSDGISELKRNLEELYEKYKWALHQEKRQLELAESQNTHVITQQPMDSVQAKKHYKEIKKEIMQRLKQEIAAKMREREQGFVTYGLQKIKRI